MFSLLFVCFSVCLFVSVCLSVEEVSIDQGPNHKSLVANWMKIL